MTVSRLRYNSNYGGCSRGKLRLKRFLFCGRQAVMVVLQSGPWNGFIVVDVVIAVVVVEGTRVQLQRLKDV